MDVLTNIRILKHKLLNRDYIAGLTNDSDYVRIHNKINKKSRCGKEITSISWFLKILQFINTKITKL